VTIHHFNAHTGDDSTPTQVPTDALRGGYSPRSAGEVAEHAQVLAEADGPLPPILVQRGTMRVIDGMHRLRAAILRGESTVAVRYFDGDEAQAFAAAVRANVTHGLPLTLSDREAAVGRLIAMFPDWSDRRMARIAGLAPSTVAAIRSRVGASADAASARIGRDGRVRPLNSAPARLAASEILAERPDASLREVARLTGLSPTTVHDVRERMRRGDDPVPSPDRATVGRRRGSAERRQRREIAWRDDVRDPITLLQILERDPSLRFSEAGRSILRWLSSSTRALPAWPDVADAIPPHTAHLAGELAASCVREWQRFGDALEQRVNDAG
jgi:ParB-like chromosome segregation protein Spo0J